MSNVKIFKGMGKLLYVYDKNLRCFSFLCIFANKYKLFIDGNNGLNRIKAMLVEKIKLTDGLQKSWAKTKQQFQSGVQINLSPHLKY